MKKKLWLAALALTAVFTFGACGGAGEGKDAKDNQSQGQEEAGADVGQTGTEAGADEGHSGGDTEEGQPKESKIIFTEQTLVDNEDCTVKVTGIDPEGMWGYTLSFMLENKTDRTLVFAIEGSSVNGLMVDPFWATEVTASSIANEDVDWNIADIESAGMSVADIAFWLRVYDSADLNAEDLLSEEFHIYPLGEDKAQQFTYTPDETDIVLFENEYAKMIVTGFDPEGDYGYVMKVYLLNKTEDTLMFSVESCSVNGFMLDPFWAITVSGQRQAFSEISWETRTFEENNITDVNEIQLELSIYNSEDPAGEDYYHGNVTVNP